MSTSGAATWALISDSSMSALTNTAAVNNNTQLIDGLAPLDFDQPVPPPFTGIPTAPTAAVDTNTPQLATTAFVHQAPGQAPGIAQHRGDMGLAIPGAVSSLKTGTWVRVTLVGGGGAGGRTSETDNILGRGGGGGGGAGGMGQFWIQKGITPNWDTGYEVGGGGYSYQGQSDDGAATKWGSFTAGGGSGGGKGGDVDGETVGDKGGEGGAGGKCTPAGDAAFVAVDGMDGGRGGSGIGLQGAPGLVAPDAWVPGRAGAGAPGPFVGGSAGNSGSGEESISGAIGSGGSGGYVIPEAGCPPGNACGAARMAAPGADGIMIIRMVVS